VLRYFGWDRGDRLLIVNLGCDLDLTPIPEPLLAPPPQSRWTIQWSSETVRYGGQGTPPFRADATWIVPGEAAILLRSGPLDSESSSRARSTGGGEAGDGKKRNVD
jgi:maltooligosyltrehalose trehalohydrolase